MSDREALVQPVILVGLLHGLGLAFLALRIIANKKFSGNFDGNN
jgi:hypothetical protein